MQWNIPGTVLTVPVAQADQAEEKLSAMFWGGGVVLSQISAVTGLEPYIIQNWVRRGFLSSPINKKYTLRQFCRILNINMLKDALQMEQICGLLGYINGDLDDERDDLIDDSQLYFLFLRIAAYHRQTKDPSGRDAYIRQVLSNYKERIPGARERVEKVLQIMLTAWAAASLRQQAVSMINTLNFD